MFLKVYIYICVCVCVCKCKREREREEGEAGRFKDKKRMSHTKFLQQVFNQFQ